MVNYAGNDAEGRSAVEEITAKGGRAIAVRADVADEVAVAAALRRAPSRPSAVSTSSSTRPASCSWSPRSPSSTSTDLDRMHRINIRGTFVVAQQAARRLRGAAR